MSIPHSAGTPAPMSTSEDHDPDTTVGTRRCATPGCDAQFPCVELSSREHCDRHAPMSTTTPEGHGTLPGWLTAADAESYAQDVIAGVIDRPKGGVYDTARAILAKLRAEGYAIVPLSAATPSPDNRLGPPRASTEHAVPAGHERLEALQAVIASGVWEHYAEDEAGRMGDTWTCDGCEEKVEAAKAALAKLPHSAAAPRSASPPSAPEGKKAREAMAAAQAEIDALPGGYGIGVASDAPAPEDNHKESDHGHRDA